MSVYLHINNPDFPLTGNHLRPYILMDLAVPADHFLVID